VNVAQLLPPNCSIALLAALGIPLLQTGTTVDVVTGVGVTFVGFGIGFPPGREPSQRN
jgi:hypothetical protein